MSNPDSGPDAIEAPPFLRNWPNVYAGVLVYLAVLLALLYVLTVFFRY